MHFFGCRLHTKKVKKKEKKKPFIFSCANAKGDCIEGKNVILIALKDILKGFTNYENTQILIIKSA